MPTTPFCPSLHENSEPPQNLPSSSDSKTRGKRTNYWKHGDSGDIYCRFSGFGPKAVTSFAQQILEQTVTQEEEHNIEVIPMDYVRVRMTPSEIREFKKRQRAESNQNQPPQKKVKVLTEEDRKKSQLYCQQQHVKDKKSQESVVCRGLTARVKDRYPDIYEQIKSEVLQTKGLTPIEPKRKKEKPKILLRSRAPGMGIKPSGFSLSLQESTKTSQSSDEEEWKEKKNTDSSTSTSETEDD